MKDKTISANKHLATEQKSQHYYEKENARDQLLSGLPVTERRLSLAGISTPVLEGGDGPPVIMLHGPGESATWWLRVIPKLVMTNKVIVPDLPGHGASVVDGKLKATQILPWLNALIEHTCSIPPTLVGHILGGSIAARFAIDYQDKVKRLILVNSLGLAKFRPAPMFAFGLIRFMLRPTEKNFIRFLPQCLYDLDDLQHQMGNKWDPFLAYNIACAQDPEHKTALQMLMKQLGTPKLPSKDLERIKIPTALIWGRLDRANKLKIAEHASMQYGWPLHVIENTRDDPKLERPEEFVDVLYKILGRPTEVNSRKENQ